MIGPDIYSFVTLWRRYRQCRRNKRNTINALAFEYDAETSLLDLRKELIEHTYTPGRSICFITEGPKPREVFAADFRDRVVHHLLVSYQERLFEPVFIHDSYACRKGKGSLAASSRLMCFLRKITSNGKRPAWAAKLDVADFFPSINKDTLYEIIRNKVYNPELLWLTRVILFHDPTTNYIFKSRKKDVYPPGTPKYPIPARKSLFGSNNESGLPIGNLTSQFWGNVYLNELDQFIKRELKCKYYIRYVDDMILLSHERNILERWIKEISYYIESRLKLKLRRGMNKPFSVGRGIEFVGWKTWWNRRMPRLRIFGNLKKILDSFEMMFFHSGCNSSLHVNIGDNDNADYVNYLNAVMASYAGHLKHGLALRQWKEIWDRYLWLSALFKRDVWRIEAR